MSRKRGEGENVRRRDLVGRAAAVFDFSQGKSTLPARTVVLRAAYRHASPSSQPKRGKWRS